MGNGLLLNRYLLIIDFNAQFTLVTQWHEHKNIHVKKRTVFHCCYAYAITFFLCCYVVLLTLVTKSRGLIKFELGSCFLTVSTCFKTGASRSFKLELVDLLWKLAIEPYSNFDCSFVCLSTARERIVGWYHTGPKLHHNDVKVNELIRRYCSNSVRKHSFTFKANLFEQLSFS